jgi:hypothetical protein
MKIFDIAYTAANVIIGVVENQNPSGIILTSSSSTGSVTPASRYKFVHQKSSGIMVATVYAEDEMQAYSKFMQELELYK